MKPACAWSRSRGCASPAPLHACFSSYPHRSFHDVGGGNSQGEKMGAHRDDDHLRLPMWQSAWRRLATVSESCSQPAASGNLYSIYLVKGQMRKALVGSAAKGASPALAPLRPRLSRVAMQLRHHLLRVPVISTNPPRSPPPPRDLEALGAYQRLGSHN